MHRTAKTTARTYFAGLVWLAAIWAITMLSLKLLAEAGAAVTVNPIIVVVGVMIVAIVLTSAVAAGAWSWVGRTGSASEA